MGVNILTKVLIPVAVIVIAALSLKFYEWITIPNQPPLVVIVPDKLPNAEGNVPISFSAVGSRDPEGGKLRYEWSLNGFSFGQSHAADCELTEDNPAIVSCRFFGAGTHSVAVEVEDEKGVSRSKSASVTVSILNGYISLSVQASSEEKRALLYAVDWSQVQSMLIRPLLLFDPDRGKAVYASSVERDVDRAKEALSGEGVRDNLRIDGSRLPAAAENIITTQAADAGMSISFSNPFPSLGAPSLGADDYDIGSFTAFDLKEAADGDFIFVDSPEAFARVQRGE